MIICVFRLNPPRPVKSGPVEIWIKIHLNLRYTNLDVPNQGYVTHSWLATIATC